MGRGGAGPVFGLPAKVRGQVAAPAVDACCRIEIIGVRIDRRHLETENIRVLGQLRPERLAGALRILGGISGLGEGDFCVQAIGRICGQACLPVLRCIADGHVDDAPGHVFLQFPFKGCIPVAVHPHAGDKPRRFAQRDAVPLHHFCAGAGHLIAAADEREAVAVCQRLCHRLQSRGLFQCNLAAAHGGNFSDRFAQRFRRIDAGEFQAAAVEHQLRIAPVEGLVGRSGKAAFRMAGRCRYIPGMPGDERVQHVAVVPHDVLHIRYVFQPALDLERSDAGRNQVGDAGVEPQVAGRKERPVAHEYPAVSVHQVVAGAADLGASAAVRAPSRKLLAQVAFPTIAHADGTMNEELELALHHFADGPHLLERQLAFEHQPLEAQRLQSLRPFRRPDGGLCGSVQLHGRKGQRQQVQVLDDEHVHACFAERLHQCQRLFGFLGLDQGVDRSEDPCTVQVRIAA